MMSATMTVKLAMMLGVAQAAVLPTDPRLEPVRPQLEQVVQRMTASGLPAEVVISKVREGLAKGVPADRIAVAAGKLADNLQSARSYLAERRPGVAPAELVRALAEARLAGLELAAADPVVRSGRSAPETARAVEVLTDLSLRGYPGSRVAGLVQELLARDAAALGRLPATLEVLRREQALSHGETVDALTRGLQAGGSLDQASLRAADDERRKGRAPANRGGGDGEAGRKEGFVPPGQIKKQLGSKGRAPESPGRGRR
jgi:hypothetical protein